MAGVVKVESNLQEELSVQLHFRKLKYCKKNQVLKVISHAALASHCFRNIKIQILDLEQVGQGHYV